MNYEDMSDFEVNKLVSSMVEFGDLIVTVNDSNETVYLCEKDGLLSILPVGHFNPCNNPSDAWPIMNDSRIEIKRDTCQAHVSSYFNPEFAVHCRNDEKATLRAAMICFLKMKDAENGN